MSSTQVVKSPEEESWEQRIGRRIRALRESRNVTLDQMAAQCRLTKGQLSRIENGKVSSPISTLTRVAAALGVAPGDLFSEDNGVPAPSWSRKMPGEPSPGEGQKSAISTSRWPLTCRLGRISNRT